MNSERTKVSHPAITPDHLRRLAVVYVRQSSERQVREHTGSASFQRSLAAVARSYGWPESQIKIIEDDLGKSGSSTEGRTGWQRLQQMIEAEEVGAVFGANISRLSRRVIDFELFRLRAACHNTYVDGRFINPADSNDTIVSQITAMVAQYENRKRAELIMQGRWAKAKRGKVVSRPPIGWVKRPDGGYDYDLAVKETIAMIVDTFWQTRSLGRTVKLLAEAKITLPPRWFRSVALRMNAGGPVPSRKITPERVIFILTHARQQRHPHLQAAPQNV
jgi:DNA invertase Pin-like site-specific DNA recombinase